MSARYLFISLIAALILHLLLTLEVVTAESLQCAPGEERRFEYESATKVWESAQEQLRLKGNLKIRCLETSDNSTLKYLVEVSSLEPSYDGRNTKASVRAEPVLEEVAEAIGETANRVKRSVSGWFTKTWGSVKDFFLTIFNPSERKTMSRDQVLNQDGIDIAAQCRADGKASNKLPIDDSVFDDLEPKYYIGASLDASGGPAYEFDDRNSDEYAEDMNLSFFDDPKPREARKRSKRAMGGLGSGTGALYNDILLRLPFVFVQSRSGKILEVQFSQQDKDVSVRNFKRHLCDLFATNLDKDKSHLNEVTPLGQHSTRYMQNSSFIKQSEQLVRAMAVVGMQSGASEAAASSGSSLGDTGFSVLRTINHTNSINSRTMMPDIDRMQVRVKQVQQINEGRMTGTMGQLGMSLIQSGYSAANLDFRAGKQSRFARSVDRRRPSDRPDESPEQPVEEIADLLKVSTSFSLQMVPQATARSSNTRKVSGHRARRSAKNADNSVTDSKQTAKTNLTLVDRLVSKPVDLVKTMQELQLLESKLQLSPSSLALETDRDEGKAQRLEVLQDQIQMRINEELLQNKHKLANLKLAASRQTGGGGTTIDGAAKLTSSRQRNVLGLSLTQVILDNGVTAKRKGSIYSTLEEVIELEMSLGEDTEFGSVSRLLRDTVRMDSVRTYCKSAIPSLEEIRVQSNRLQLRLPFDIEPDKESSTDVGDEHKLARIVGSVAKKNRRRLEQCKQVVQLLLRVSERQAVDLVIDLIDESNNRLLSSSKDEELGYGPTSRYYRNLRQQFTELLDNINRPTEAMLDKLMARLPYLAPASSFNTANWRRSNDKSGGDSQKPKPEFVYVTPKSVNDQELKAQSKYNRSLLKELDDFNSNDGAGSLVMSITSLASKSSIGPRKRIEIIEKLLFTIKQSSCNLFEGPDLDILESMANFNEPIDELTGKLIHLARRCKHQDQYLVACVHGLRGQLAHSVAQRFLAEQLRSNNVSCIVKSEIVLTLIDRILIDDLQQAYQQSSSSPNSRNDIPLAHSDSSNLRWPSSGLNQVDDILLERSGVRRSTANETKGQQNAQDRKCLNQLVSYYMSKKHPIGNDISSALDRTMGGISSNKRARSRNKRAIRNENSFWDEASCKRWSIQPNAAGSNDNGTMSLADLANELDDNTILQALANKNISNLVLSSRSGAASSLPHRAERLVEKEEGAERDTFVRRRHKCSASKKYGPKNAEAILRAEVVNDLVGQKDENKFLARFRLATNFLGNRIDVGRMYLWHQKRTTRAHVNILGKSLWDTSHSCQDKAPNHLLYVPLFDFNLWLVKVSVGMRLQSEMGFFSNCRPANDSSRQFAQDSGVANDQLELYPTITARASGEATAKFVVARVGLSLASQYGYQGSIRVSRQPESCMSIESAHQPMNVTFSSWFQLWDSDCHYWGSRRRAEPQATRWRLNARQPTTWLDDECLQAGPSTSLLPSEGLNKSTTILPLPS